MIVNTVVSKVMINETLLFVSFVLHSSYTKTSSTMVRIRMANKAM